MGSRQRHSGIGLPACLVVLAGAIAPALILLLAGCRPAGTPETPSGRLKVVMGRTPAPTEPIRGASITITQVEVLRQRTSRRLPENAGLLALPQTLEPVDHSWIVVHEGEQIVDLLEIRAGRANLLLNADIPEGHYSSLRLTCGQGRITLDRPQGEASDDTLVIDAKRGQSGEVTLDCEFLVAAGRETALLLNIDVNQAFLPIRGCSTQNDTPQGFHFSPRTSMQLVNLLSAGPSMSTAELIVGVFQNHPN